MARGRNLQNSIISLAFPGKVESHYPRRTNPP
jgi:hypothetical protein